MTNYFVVNLSVADLLVTTICMPVAVSQAISVVWIHGEVMCKLSSYLQGNFDHLAILRSSLVLHTAFHEHDTCSNVITRSCWKSFRERFEYRVFWMMHISARSLAEMQSIANRKVPLYRIVITEQNEQQSA